MERKEAHEFVHEENQWSLEGQEAILGDSVTHREEVMKMAWNEAIA